MLDADARPFCSPDTPPQWVRPRRFRIDHVDLAVAIDLDARRVEGNVTHAVALLPHGDGQRLVELDQHGLEILGAWIDGAAVPFSVSPGGLAVAVPTEVAAAFSLRIAFRATAPAKGMFFIPADPARGQVAMCWTQGAMEDHSHWFPCFDSPNNLSTYHFSIRHRSGMAAVANGEPAGITDHGDGWATTTYNQAKAHVLYLVNVVVGDLVAVADGSGSVPIAHWLPRGKEDGASAMFRATAFAIRWLGDYIGVPFAWSRYGHVVVHGFMWGGMENTTLTTITDRVLMDAAVQAREDVDADSLVVHELVHQWFGDLLTMKGWADIWLNESFATYLEARGTAAWKAHSAGFDAADHLALELWGNRAAYLEEDSGRYRRALVTNRYVDAYELFDRVAYEKGSLVLHHLCCYLGEERFRAALALYTRRHAHDLVETADWRQALEDATGEPLDWFFDQWVQRAGHPCLKIRWRHDPARGQLIVEVEQTQATGPDQVFRLPTALAWGAADGGAARIAVDLAKAKQTLVVALATAPRWVALDPDGTIPGEWDEAGDSAQILARAGDAALGAQARARALVAVGATVPGGTLVVGLAVLAIPGAPELVRIEAIAALGRLRSPTAQEALLTAWSATPEPRLRRALARALAQFRGTVAVGALAERVVALADAEPSRLTAGELLATRGALEHPGATSLLRARLAQPSWNDRLRAAVLRGLGDSGEPAALDEALALLADPAQVDAVRCAAAAAAGQLGARLLPARDRVRRALEPCLHAPSLHLRVAAARALGALADPAAAGAVATQDGREVFGNVRRVLREVLDQLAKARAVITATAELAKRVDELEKQHKAQDVRLEALEKRLGPG